MQRVQDPIYLPIFGQCTVPQKSKPGKRLLEKYETASCWCGRVCTPSPLPPHLLTFARQEDAKAHPEMLHSKSQHGPGEGEWMSDLGGVPKLAFSKNVAAQRRLCFFMVLQKRFQGKKSKLKISEDSELQIAKLCSPDRLIWGDIVVKRSVWRTWNKSWRPDLYKKSSERQRWWSQTRRRGQKLSHLGVFHGPRFLRYPNWAYLPRFQAPADEMCSCRRNRATEERGVQTWSLPAPPASLQKSLHRKYPQFLRLDLHEPMANNRAP